MLKQDKVIKSTESTELTELPDKFVVQLTDPKTGFVGYMGFKRIHKRAFERHLPQQTGHQIPVSL